MGVAALSGARTLVTRVDAPGRGPPLRPLSLRRRDRTWRTSQRPDSGYDLCLDGLSLLTARDESGHRGGPVPCCGWDDLSPWWRGGGEGGCLGGPDLRFHLTPLAPREADRWWRSCGRRSYPPRRLWSPSTRVVRTPPIRPLAARPYASLLSEAGLETGPLLLRPLRYLREPNVTATLRGRPTGALLDMLPSFCDLLFTTLTVSLFFLVEEWPKTSVISSPKASVM